MISDAMERILQELYADARARSFELITLEQLLLALMEQSDNVQQVLEALHVDLDVLSGQLVSSIQDNTPTLPPNLMDKVETQPTLGFQRVMQRAIVHAQSVEKREVQPVDVLVALMSEKDCPAVYFLQLQSVSRVEILRDLAPSGATMHSLVGESGIVCDDHPHASMDDRWRVPRGSPHCAYRRCARRRGDHERADRAGSGSAQARPWTGRSPGLRTGPPDDSGRHSAWTLDRQPHCSADREFRVAEMVHRDERRPRGSSRPAH